MERILALGYAATKALFISGTIFCIVLLALMLWGSRKIGKKQQAEQKTTKRSKPKHKSKSKKQEPTHTDVMLQNLIKEHEQKLKESNETENLEQKEVEIKEVGPDNEE